MHLQPPLRAFDYFAWLRNCDNTYSCLGARLYREAFSLRHKRNEQSTVVRY